MPVGKPTSSPTIAHTRPQLSNQEPSNSKTFSGRTIRKLGKTIQKTLISAPGAFVAKTKKTLLNYTLKLVSPRNTLSKKDSLATQFTSTVAALENADSADQVRATLESDTHSAEDLYALSLQLPDNVFLQMREPFYSQLRTLEAKHHAEYMINDCRDDKGVLDSSKLSRALAQHREFIAKTSDNMFFTDGANYVKSRLTMPGMAPCELLCRLRGCSAADFRLPPDTILKSGASSVLQEAQYFGGQELKAARREAAEMVEKQLQENSPKLLKHLGFQFRTANTICSKMEQMLLNKLGRDDYGKLCNQMAIQRANSCMEDLTLKVKSFDQLSQRLDNILNKHTTQEGAPEQLIGGLAGAKNLRSDAYVLGQLAIRAETLPEHVRDNAETNISVETARQLADQLSVKIETLATSEGITDTDKVKNAMHLTHALRQAANSLDKV